MIPLAFTTKSRLSLTCRPHSTWPSHRPTCLITLSKPPTLRPLCSLQLPQHTVLPFRPSGHCPGCFLGLLRPGHSPHTSPQSTALHQFTPSHPPREAFPKSPSLAQVLLAWAHMGLSRGTGFLLLSPRLSTTQALRRDAVALSSLRLTVLVHGRNDAALAGLPCKGRERKSQVNSR